MSVGLYVVALQLSRNSLVSYTGIATVNKEMYIAVRRLTVVVRRKKLEKFKTNSWFPHHENVTAHRSLLVKDFLAKHNVTAQEPSPYSSDLSPTDFYFFSRLKSAMKGLAFVDTIKNATEELKRLLQNGF
jgi:hypothetical protein